MPKTDYYDDPAAPAANSLVVGVCAFVQDDAGRVLMIRRADNRRWALPGGGQELGESTPAATIREVREETGIAVEIIGLVGIYSDPRHVIAYDDGEVRQEFAICFRGRAISGAPSTSIESTAVEWVEPNRVRELVICPSMLLRIEHGLENRPQPYLG